VNSDIITSGNSDAQRIYKIATLPAQAKARPKVLWILSVSLAPQYWAMSTELPEQKPKRISVIRKVHRLAIPTAAMVTLPRLATMAVSTSAAQEFSRFCSAIGSANVSIRR